MWLTGEYCITQELQRELTQQMLRRQQAQKAEQVATAAMEVDQLNRIREE